MPTLTIITNSNLEEFSDEMRRMVREGSGHPKVRELTMQALSFDPDQLYAIYRFIQQNYRYMPDPTGRELLVSPIRIAEDYLNSGKVYGLDCDDYAVLTSAMLQSIGYTTRLVLAGMASSEIDHAYTEVYIADTWITYDLASTLPLGYSHKPVKVVYLDC